MSDNGQAVISIIIPMYNVETYIHQCIKSLLDQTFQDFEMICVDDGSEDGTRDAIREYMEADDRIRLIEQPHCGKAGVLRNIGLGLAKGEYCLFLDSDDYFEPVLLEHGLEKIQVDHADICLFNARLYNETTGAYKKMDYVLQKEYFPEQIPFAGKGFPYIFNITNGCAWTKLFRKSYLDRHPELQFMDLNRSNDLYFVFLALLQAEKITILDEVLVNYRRSADSLQGHNDTTPLDWYYAVHALRKKIMELGMYSREVELSLKNLVIGIGIYNLRSLKTPGAFKEVYARLKQEIFPEFKLDEFSKEECYPSNDAKYEIYCRIMELELYEYLFQEIENQRAEKTVWANRAKKAEKELKSVKKELKKEKEKESVKNTSGAEKVKSALRRLLKR